MSRQSLILSLWVAGIPLLACSPQKKGYSGSPNSGNAPAPMDNAVVIDNDDDDTSSKVDNTNGSTSNNSSTTPPKDYCGSLGIVGGTAATVNDMVTKSTVRLILGQEYCTGTII